MIRYLSNTFQIVLEVALSLTLSGRIATADTKALTLPPVTSCFLQCPGLIPSATACPQGQRCVATQGSGCTTSTPQIPGRCEQTYTMSEFVSAVVPALPPPLPPGYIVPYAICYDIPNWGLVNDKCLPSCSLLADMWRNNTVIMPASPEKQSSYVRVEFPGTCVQRDPLGITNCTQASVPASGVPDGKVCCAKICGSVPRPFDYSKYGSSSSNGSSSSSSSGSIGWSKSPSSNQQPSSSSSSSSQPKTRLGPPVFDKR